MGAVGYSAAIVADKQVWMMVLLVRDLRDDIDKGYGLIIVLKRVAVADVSFFTIWRPGWIQILTECYDILMIKCTNIC